MSTYFSKSTGGFYVTAIHGDDIPVDAVEITDDERCALLDAQAAGKIIEADPDGRPVAVDPPPQPMEQVKAALCAEIDSAADAVYVAIGGPSPGRLAEYQQAKNDALAFKGAGYVGTAPTTVACWAQAQGWTDQQAADDILATASAWEGALSAIRSARLLGKANVNAASDNAAAQAAADTAIANVRAVPAGL